MFEQIITGHEAGPMVASNPGSAFTAVIVNYNAGEDLVRCVGSLVSQGPAIEIVVVDNGSLDGGIGRAKAAYPFIKVISDGSNDGYSGGANRGAAAASREFLLFLNPDVTLEPGCLDALLAALSTAAGTMVCAPVVVDGSTDVAEFGLTIDLAGDPASLPPSRPPLYVSGCALVMTRKAFAGLGGFDAAFFMFCEDLDLCWRALLHGYDVQVVPDAQVRHRGGGSTPGGYLSGGRIQVTSFRIALRERNTLATLIRCGPLAWVMLVVPLRLLRLGVLAVAAIVIGRPGLARALAAGVIWNIRRLRLLVRQRIAMPVSAGMRRRVLRERMLRDITSVRMLFRHGMPRFVDVNPR